MIINPHHEQINDLFDKLIEITDGYQTLVSILEHLPDNLVQLPAYEAFIAAAKVNLLSGLGPIMDEGQALLGQVSGVGP